MSGRAGSGPIAGVRAGSGPIAGVRAITFDFGNTLVPVRRADLAAVVDALADHVAAQQGLGRSAFLVAWGEERERQFREEVPQFREVDLSVRLVRVLARLRGIGPPGPGTPWDDVAAATLSDPAEIAAGLEVYSRAFVAAIPPDPAIRGLLARLAGRGLRLGILSNWPLAATIDRYLEAAGWRPFLAAVVVSERVGTIKPDAAIFRAAEAMLGAPGGPFAPATILHVGDDWAADVAGGRAAGWRVAWLRSRPADSPLPGSEPGSDVVPDLVLDRLADVEASLGLGPVTRGRRPVRLAH